jgi:hypothetical protein
MKTLRDIAGPTFYSFDAIGVQVFAMLNNTKLSPHELPIVETSMPPDLVTCILRKNG